MKKNFNKIASLVLAAAMMGSMPITALAAGTHSIKIGNCSAAPLRMPFLCKT